MKKIKFLSLTRKGKYTRQDPVLQYIRLTFPCIFLDCFLPTMHTIRSFNEQGAYPMTKAATAAALTMKRSHSVLQTVKGQLWSPSLSCREQSQPVRGQVLDQNLNIWSNTRRGCATIRGAIPDILSESAWCARSTAEIRSSPLPLAAALHQPSRIWLLGHAGRG